ncbi:MAG TPA: protein kinase [Nitrospiria bacterium]|nr:protein kinase [Nitrospiria bacterium]
MPPQHFGKYLLIDKIGTGGMAEVYLAKQSGLKGFEKVVAIKRILPHLTQDPEFISMFINEAKLAALLTHQNIVQIFDLGHLEDFYYIAMEYVMGKDLRTLLHRAKTVNKPLFIGQVLSIVTKICAGLDYAHRKKDLNGQDLSLVHRDISPQNVLVSYEGEVKLVDFGIAKAASQSSETRTGFLKGKLSYMAPEQAWGKPVDRRTDIFAMGIVLYEMLTGHKLFKGDNDFNTLEKIREAKVEPPPTQLNAHISEELEAIILKALAREPKDRFQSAAEFLMALEDHCVKKSYDTSTLRLSQHLQVLFAADIEQDANRFRTAINASTAVHSQDQSTLIRRTPREGDEVTPSRPTKTRQPARHPKTRPRSSPVRLTILMLIFMFLASVWAASTNHFILYSIKIRIPASQAVIEQLARMPDQAGHFLFTLPVLFPSRTSLPEFSEDPQQGEIQVEKEALPILSAPAEGRTAGHRILTEAEKSEVRQLFKEAQADYDQRRLDEVEHKLRRIIELDPRVPTAYHLLGTVLLERKDPVGALRIFEEASRNFPDSPLLHYDLGFLYFNQGVVSLAHEELGKALKLNPDGPNAQKARKIIGEEPRP